MSITQQGPDAAIRPASPLLDLTPLRLFVRRMGEILATIKDEPGIVEQGRAALAQLIARDDWLPERYAQPRPDRYQQYLLHCDSRERFSVVSFVWGPGQSTPIHDHRVWGLVGVLRGAEKVESYRKAPGGLTASAAPTIMKAGEVEAVSPRIGDIHRVANALADEVTISIHVYGANIGAVRRSTFDPAGVPTPFISGYADVPLPNLWQPQPSA